MTKSRQRVIEECNDEIRLLANFGVATGRLNLYLKYIMRSEYNVLAFVIIKIKIKENKKKKRC